jgi:hypothetical protein
VSRLVRGGPILFQRLWPTASLAVTVKWIVCPASALVSWYLLPVASVIANAGATRDVAATLSIGERQGGSSRRAPRRSFRLVRTQIGGEGVAAPVEGPRRGRDRVVRPRDDRAREGSRFALAVEDERKT